MSIMGDPGGNAVTPLTTKGLLPWWLRCLGESKVRSVSVVSVLSDGQISWVLCSQGLQNPPPATTVTKQSNTLKRKEGKTWRRETRPREIKGALTLVGI